MGTQIKAITIINLQGSKRYCVGSTHNDLYLAKIEDRSLEYPESFTSLYAGLTHSNELVFVVVNAPVEVEYCAEEPK